MRARTISATFHCEEPLTIPTRMREISECLRLLGEHRTGWVPVRPWVHSARENCHNNSLRYVDWYGGVVIRGYYWVRSRTCAVAISHSIVRTAANEYIDITPFQDERPSNLFTYVSSGAVVSADSNQYGFCFDDRCA